MTRVFPFSVPFLLVVVLGACGPASPAAPDGDTDELPAADAAVIGPPASIRVVPAVQDYGTVETGIGTSAVLRLQNPGASPTPTIAVSLSGTDAHDFSVESGGCGGMALRPGLSCSIGVSFNPSTAGSKRATLRILAGSLSATAELAGVGLAPGALKLSPSTPSLGSVAIGQKGSVPITLTNGGGATAGPLTLTLGGSDAAEFSLTVDNCSGKTLAGGASCAVTAVFTPSSAGAKVASLAASASSDDQAAVALVAQASGTVALTVLGSGSGKVTSSPEGLECGVGCSDSHGFDSSPVTLVALPDPGTLFESWTGCDATPSPTVCVVDLNAAQKPVQASFKPAPPPPDAPVARPDAAPPAPDAFVPPPPDAPTGDDTFRVWAGDTARLRVIDAELFGSSTFGNACIYGNDGNATPYDALPFQSEEPGQIAFRSASYENVPAGIPLRLAVDYQPGIDGCSPDFAGLVREGTPLSAGHSYTAVVTFTADNSLCSTPPIAGCDYVPPEASANASPGHCPQLWLNVFDDGYPQNWRVINLTENTAGLSVSTDADEQTVVPNAAGEEVIYESHGIFVSDSSDVRICPWYVGQCYANLDAEKADDDVWACTKGDDTWTLFSATVDRVTSGSKQTTIYVVGSAPPPLDDGSGLDQSFFSDVTIIVADDVAD